MSHEFAGQVAVVSGAASGLGRAIAMKVLAEGARVAMLDLNEAALTSVAREAGDNAYAFPLDVTNEAQVHSVIERIGKQFGRLDILVNSAGVTGKTNIKSHEIDAADVRFVLNVNFMGSFLTARGAALDAETELWADSAHRFDCGEGRKCRDARLLGFKSRCCRHDKGSGQGVRRDRHHH
jgi:NAD(P)-dependent dehydrogenase (short-subunit alcohol dehydrogenase family)